MKVEHFAVVVFRYQKIALFSPAVFVRIMLGLLQPCLACRCQVIPQHSGQIGFVGQIEYRGLRGFGCDVRLQIHRQLALDVLASILLVFSRPALARDVWGLGIEV